MIGKGGLFLVAPVVRSVVVLLLIYAWSIIAFAEEKNSSGRPFTVPTEQQIQLLKKVVDFYKNNEIDDVTSEAIEARLGYPLERYGHSEQYQTYKIIGIPDAELKQEHSMPNVSIIIDKETKKVNISGIVIGYSQDTCFSVGSILSIIDVKIYKRDLITSKLKSYTTYSTFEPQSMKYPVNKAFGFGVRDDGCVRGFGVVFNRRGVE